MNNKQWNRAYYKRIGKTLSIYILFCIAMIIFNFLYEDNTDFVAGILNMLSFKHTYAWYVEMYLGLFILIPFLNVLYHGLSTQRKKQVLLLTLFVSCFLPSLINIWNVTSISFWKQPAAYDSYQKIMPEYWLSLWPLLYYFMGCYLSEYPLKISRKRTLLMIVVICILFGGFCFYRSYGFQFVWGEWNGYESPFTLILSVLVFHTLSSLNCDKIGALPRRLLARLSNWTFGAYLCSFIIDELLYNCLRNYEPAILKRLKYYFLLVPICYIGSLLLSAILNLIYSFISKAFFRRTKQQQ